MEQIKCPHCGKTHYTITGNNQTCLYNPVVVGPDGRISMNDSNIYVSNCECLDCGERFDIRSQYGKTTVLDCGPTDPRPIPAEFSRTTIIGEPVTAELAIGTALKTDRFCINFDHLRANPEAGFTLILDGKEHSFENLDTLKEKLREFFKMK